ncbi:MAG: class I SAM-dependent methyltransferase [Bacilli bacterium]|nr:class I SAM-dependent methyltransferase [Bacilli bacterium]
MNEQELINYYNKFNEDKRLKTRHGYVEFYTTMKYINEYLKNYDNPKIMDIGAGTGAYSIPLAEKYDVTAVELVKHNLRVIEKNSEKVHAFQGNALDLSKFPDEYADVTLLFGPMYHLISMDEKLAALKEAKRITKKDGIIFVAYIMDDYRLITHGFKEKNIKESKMQGLLSDDYHIVPKSNDLYSSLRLNEIDELNRLANLKRIKIITPDGPSNYIRPYLNKLDDDEFSLFMEYHLKNCERLDLMGAAAHTLDILKK